MANIFISYTQKEPDYSLAKQFYNALKSSHKTFFASESIRIGENWPERIQQELAKSDYFLVFLSEPSLQDEMVKDEVKKSYELQQSGNKPEVLAIRVNLPVDIDINNCLSGYLDAIFQSSWNSERDTEKIIKEITHFIEKKNCLLDVNAIKKMNELSSANFFLQKKKSGREKLDRKDKTKIEIFISFKNTDKDNFATRDSVIAQKVTKFLEKKGFSVFFSPSSLQHSGNSSYKKVIDNALEEATILIVIGTKKEYLTSEWVSYEWNSFYQEVIGGFKKGGQLFTIIEEITIKNLPMNLRQNQVFKYSKSEMKKMEVFISNALLNSTSN